MLYNSRLARMILFVCFLILAYHSVDIIEWVGKQNCWLWVTWGMMALAFIWVEVGLYHRKRTKRKANDIVDEKPLMPLLDDQPTTEDKLGREEYVMMLGRKIISTFVANKNKNVSVEDDHTANGSAFAINIEEDYGYGKTSFLMMLHKWFYEEHQGLYTWIDFKPWLCDNPCSLISEFFHQLAQEININVDLRKDIIEYGNVLASQAIKIGTGVQLTNIFKSHESYLKSMHDTIRNGLRKNSQLIIITIDDLDRLDKDEVIAVLKLVRNTADFPNIFYITATEHTYLYNVLLSSGIKEPDRYIEKFFNLHFYLPAHEVNLRETFIDLFGAYAKTIAKIEDRSKESDALKNEPILKTCFSDIRDVKRFVNQLVIYLESLGTKDYNLYDATMLALLQYKCPEIYKILRDKDDILLLSKPSGTDSILELKDDPIKELELREFQHLMDKDKQQAEPKKEEPIPDLSERQGKERPYRNEQLGESILNVLFGSKTPNNEFAIKRVNNFFLYFSGKEHSKSITKAEAATIMGLDINSYKAAIDKLFQQDRADAFLQEIEYIVNNAKESNIPDIIRKIFYFQYRQYDYTPAEHRRERSWYAVNVQSHDLFSILYVLMGDLSPRQYRRKNKPCPNLTPLMKEESLIYVVELVSVINRNIAEFEYQHKVIDGWVKTIYERFFTENIKQHTIFTENNLRLMEYFRDEMFTYRSNWDKTFSEYLCSDIGIIRLWLSHIIKDYGGRYEWNYSVKQVMFGSTYDYRGKALMAVLKTKYTGLSSALDNLESLLKYKDLVEKSHELKEDPFVKEFAQKTNSK